ncbi:hypothetical protein ASPCAL12788 [Aspergillus calidoustus]|uniref:SRR1-like domain-containing protein n=1 Tax=Aspergillus calidoustus TaxID=454130 RepID=A0A0U5GEG1_ASPCI|nr:hypothetical protein ASPCAL12788 [Aspergillus calidoustus]
MQYFKIGPSRCIDEPRAAAPPTPAQAQSQIDEWLHMGKPLFPRDAIQAIHDQLRDPIARGDEILVKALDGATMAFEVRTGDIKESEQQRETIGKPSIRYICYESLRSGQELSSRRPHLVYCPMIIRHEATTSNLMTGGALQTIPRRSIDDIYYVFNTALHLWEESDTWIQIKATLLSTQATTIVKKIIAFACGTMSHPDDIPGASYNSIFQHAFLVTLQRLLQQEANGQIACAVQDPAYTDADRAVLETYGIRVLDDPEGFLEVDDRSLVLSCSPNVPVKQIVVDVAKPAVVIWERVENGNCRGTDPDSPRVRQVMTQLYDALEFPYEEHFGDMVIYVRRGLEDARGMGASTEAINEPHVPNA